MEDVWNFETKDRILEKIIFSQEVLTWNKEHQPCLHLLQGTQQAQQAPGGLQGLVLHLSQRGLVDLFLPVLKIQQIIILL